jgi:hypothetical protein
MPTSFRLEPSWQADPGHVGDHAAGYGDLGGRKPASRQGAGLDGGSGHHTAGRELAADPGPQRVDGVPVLGAQAGQGGREHAVLLLEDVLA